jgi:hemerythrin-like domain-containing protein
VSEQAVTTVVGSESRLNALAAISAAAHPWYNGRAMPNAKALNALNVLMEDHQYVRKSYREFKKLDPEEDTEQVQALVKQVCAALKVHVRIEEEVFYPAVRRAIKDKDLIDEAEVEHDSAKILIRQLTRMNPRDPKYAATFTVLCEYVEHHVKEEESEMFPKVRRARLNLQALGKKLMARKIRLGRP